MTTITSYTKDHIDDLVDSLKIEPFSRKTTHYTLVLVDNKTCIEMNSVNPNNLIVPKNADVPFVIGTVINVIQINVGVTTIVPDTGVTVNSLGGLFDISGQYGVVKLHKVAADTWYLSGNLA